MYSVFPDPVSTGSSCFYDVYFLMRNGAFAIAGTERPA